MVYVYPIDYLGEKDIDDEKLKVMKLVFRQKAEEFLERLSVQLAAQNRWPWLNKIDIRGFKVNVKGLYPYNSQAANLLIKALAVLKASLQYLSHAKDLDSTIRSGKVSNLFTRLFARILILSGNLRAPDLFLHRDP
jgi:hypothetical protein